MLFAWEYEQTGDLVAAAETVKSTWLELGGLFEISRLRVILQALTAWINKGSSLHIESIVDNTKIKDKIKQLIPSHLRISDLKRIELAINATCLITGKTVAFTRENDTYICCAVLASGSLTFIFETQAIGLRLLR